MKLSKIYKVIMKSEDAIQFLKFALCEKYENI
jgi:hypothetical protein